MEKPVQEVTPAPAPVKRTYELKAKETEMLLALNIGVLNGKAEVFDLQNKIKESQEKLAKATQEWAGALQFLRHSQGFQTIDIAPDMKTISGI